MCDLGILNQPARRRHPINTFASSSIWLKGHLICLPVEKHSNFLLFNSDYIYLIISTSKLTLNTWVGLNNNYLYTWMSQKCRNSDFTPCLWLSFNRLGYLCQIWQFTTMCPSVVQLLAWCVSTVAWVVWLPPWIQTPRLNACSLPAPKCSQPFRKPPSLFPGILSSGHPSTGNLSPVKQYATGIAHRLSSYG